MEELKAMANEFEKTKKEISDKFEGEVTKVVNSLFEKHSDLYGIRWTQGTPSFNDGEPCTFNVHDLEFFTCDQYKEIKKDSEISDDDVLNEDWEEVSYKPDNELEKDLKKLQDLLQDLSDFCEGVFGNGAEITYIRDKEEPIIGDFYMDY